MIWLIPFPIAGIGVGRELLQREHYVLEGSVAYRMGNLWPYSDEGFWSSRFSIITMGLGIRYALPERVGELGNSESGDRANNLIVGGRAAAGLILLCNECGQFPAGYRTVSFYIGKERRENRLIMIDSWFTRSWRYYYEDTYTYLDWESHGIVTVAAQRNVGRLLWLRGGIGGTFGMSNWSSMARRVGPVITAGAGVNVVTVGATTIDVQMQVAAGAYPYFTRGFSVSSRVMAALGIGVSWRSFGD